MVPLTTLGVSVYLSAVGAGGGDVSTLFEPSGRGLVVAIPAVVSVGPTSFPSMSGTSVRRGSAAATTRAVPFTVPPLPAVHTGTGRRPVRFNPHVAVDPGGGVDGTGAWVCVDLGWPGVFPTHMALASRHPFSAALYPRSWRVLGSQNGTAWVTLLSCTDDTSLDGDSSVTVRPLGCANGLPDGVRFLLLQQCGRNSGGTDELVLSGLEVYGRVIVARPRRPLPAPQPAVAPGYARRAPVPDAPLPRPPVIVQGNARVNLSSRGMRKAYDLQRRASTVQSQQHTH
jgi:hypothetical protein